MSLIDKPLIDKGEKIPLHRDWQSLCPSWRQMAGHSGHFNGNPLCKYKHMCTTMLLDTGFQVTMIQGYPTNLENFKNKTGVIKRLEGKLTPGTWVHRFLTIDGPDLENIFRMDVIAHHITRM